MQQRNTMYYSPREGQNQMVSARPAQLQGQGSPGNKGFLHNLMAALGCTTRDPYANEQGMGHQKALAFDSPPPVNSARRDSKSARSNYSQNNTLFSDGMKSGQFPHGLSAGEQVLIENGLAFLDRPDDSKINSLNMERAEADGIKGMS